jgi:hypothetical protein
MVLPQLWAGLVFGFIRVRVGLPAAMPPMGWAISRRWLWRGWLIRVKRRSWAESNHQSMPSAFL